MTGPGTAVEGGAPGASECGGRRGATLVELLVALTLLAVVGTAIVQVLEMAEAELERAEVTLRAVLMARDLAEGPAVEAERELPRGALSGVRIGGGGAARMHLVYAPEGELQAGSTAIARLRLRPREWWIPSTGDGGAAGDGMPGGGP